MFFKKKKKCPLFHVCDERFFYRKYCARTVDLRDGFSCRNASTESVYWYGNFSLFRVDFQIIGKTRRKIGNIYEKTDSVGFDQRRRPTNICRPINLKAKDFFFFYLWFFLSQTSWTFVTFEKHSIVRNTRHLNCRRSLLSRWFFSVFLKSYRKLKNIRFEKFEKKNQRTQTTSEYQKDFFFYFQSRTNISVCVIFKRGDQRDGVEGENPRTNSHRSLALIRLP